MSTSVGYFFLRATQIINSPLFLDFAAATNNKQKQKMTVEELKTQGNNAFRKVCFVDMAAAAAQLISVRCL